MATSSVVAPSPSRTVLPGLHEQRRPEVAAALWRLVVLGVVELAGGARRRRERRRGLLRELGDDLGLRSADEDDGRPHD